MIRGEDKAISITIEDSAGVLQSTDAMADLLVYIYSDKQHAIQAKYSKVLAAGFTQLLRVSATEYTAILPKSVTDLIPIADLRVEVELQETDVRFSGSIRRTKGKGVIDEVCNTLIDE